MKTVFSDDMELKWAQYSCRKAGMITSLQKKIDGVVVELNAYACEIGQ